MASSSWSRCCHILAMLGFVITQAFGQTEEVYETTNESGTDGGTAGGTAGGTDDGTAGGTVGGTDSATTEEPGIGLNKLIALIVLGSVLAFLLLAVVTCGCWVCRRMRRRSKVKDRVVIEGHYSNKATNNGSRSKVIAVRENVYHQKPKSFWGVQHAVAEAMEPQSFYGSNGEGGAYGGQRAMYGSPSYSGAGPRSPYLP